MVGWEEALIVTTVLRLEFPWGRYHATPWGRNVNEGHPEWPPSPWRILRALFSVWKTRCPHLRAEDVEAALLQLAGSPTIHAPTMKPAHLRHYMPQSGHRSIRKPDTTLTFDPFAAIDPRTPVCVEWNLEIGEAPRRALEEMADALPYVGRSESICDAALVSRVEHPGLEAWRPAGPDDRQDAEVLCARQPFAVSDLVQSPDVVRRNGRLVPTGSKLTPYTTSRPAPRPTITSTWRPTYEAVRLAVHPRPRPRIADAVVVGELLRRAALKKHRVPSEALSGKRPSGGHRLDGHQHAHYLSLPHDQRSGADVPIDSMVVWAPGRLGGDELAALARVKWLRAGPSTSGVPDIAVAVAAFGDVGEVAPSIVGPSSAWVSRTPFAPGRHGPRLSWAEHIGAEIERELSIYRDLPAPVSVTVINADSRRYRRYRLPPKEAMGSSRRAAMVQIQFAQPVKGPIVIGSLSHFGLGLFLPSEPVR